MILLDGKSLNMFTKENKFRKFLFDLVTHKRFDLVIIGVIVVSAI